MARVRGKPSGRAKRERKAARYKEQGFKERNDERLESTRNEEDDDS